MVGPPLWKIWVRQLGWIKNGNQTTNQINIRMMTGGSPIFEESSRRMRLQQEKMGISGDSINSWCDDEPCISWMYTELRGWQVITHHPSTHLWWWSEHMEIMEQRIAEFAWPHLVSITDRCFFSWKRIGIINRTKDQLMMVKNPRCPFFINQNIVSDHQPEQHGLTFKKKPNKTRRDHCVHGWLP